MGLKFNGSTGYLQVNGTMLSSLPCGVMAFCAGTNPTNPGVVVMHSDTATPANVALKFRDTGTSKYANLQRVGGQGMSAIGGASPDLSNTTWRLFMGAFPDLGPNTCKSYFGSNVETLETGGSALSSHDIGTHTRITIGADHYNGAGVGGYFTGHIAEVHFFSKALGDADYDAVTSGTLPETLSNWIGGWSLETYSGGGTYASIGGGTSLTLTAYGGVTASDLSPAHPLTRSSGTTATVPIITNMRSQSSIF